MPRKPRDYSKGFIYKLSCKDINVKEIYVGSSTNFRVRKDAHKSNSMYMSKKEYNYKVYKYIRENGGWDNWEMIELEKYPCNDSNELRKRENDWFLKLGASLNSHYPYRSKIQYSIDNKEKLLIAREIWNSKNKDDLKIKKKKYYTINKEKILPKIHKHYQENKKIICEYKKTYREKNKEKIQEQRKEKIICVCGSTIARFTRRATNGL